MLLAAALVMLLGTTSYSQNCTLTCPENIIVTADPGKEGTTVTLPSLALGTDCGSYTYSPASGSFFALVRIVLFLRPHQVRNVHFL